MNHNALISEDCRNILGDNAIESWRPRRINHPVWMRGRCDSADPSHAIVARPTNFFCHTSGSPSSNGNMYQDAYQIFEHLEKFHHQEPDVQSMRRLFAEKPGEAKQFLFGQTLLHKAVESYSDRLDVVDLLLGAHPKAVETEDENGLLPLHRLLMSRTWYPTSSPAVVEKLVSLRPETVVTPTKSGALPLHLACQRPAGTDDHDDAAAVRFLVGCFPDACRYRDGEGKFPLDHSLEASDPSPHVVQLLVDQFPVLLSFPDTTTGRLPLQKLLKRSRVIGRRRSFNYDRTVEVMVDGWEGSLRLQDGDLITPLLQACIDDNPLSQVYYLLRRWPEQVGAAAQLVFDSTTFNGEILYSSLALTASSSSLSKKSSAKEVGRIRQWFQRNPDFVSIPDSNGRLPLHYAVLSQSDRAHDIVLLCASCETPRNALHDQEHQQHLHPSGPLSSQRLGKSGKYGPDRPIRTADNDGRLPIHYAAASPTCGPEILDFLIESYPEGLLVADRDGRLPWHYADCSRQDVVFERTCELFPDTDVDLDLVPEEIRWDILQVTSDWNMARGGL
jgi:ankyrin repeat protein